MLKQLLGRRSTQPALQRDERAKLPNSALTRWLRQGIDLGICPLCRVAHKADREYIWNFSETGLGGEATVQALAHARGFCAMHASMLERIDRQMQSMLGVATAYAELFGELISELAAIQIQGTCERVLCPACANRGAAVADNARYLLALLDAPAGIVADRYPSSPGLCFPHFAAVWNAGGSARARRLLLDVQRRAVEQIHGDLLEFIRKEGVEARHEPRAGEQDSWQRAIQLTAGWPPPDQSAGVPERHEPAAARLQRPKP